MKKLQIIALAICVLFAAASCRNDPAPGKPNIEKITFEEPAKNIYVGDVVKVNISTEPKEAKKNEKIVYRASESGIIEIKGESGNDGVVFEGLKRGATVITASVNGAVDYCSVNVLGGSESVIPHIIVPYYVMECRDNERRSIVASLAGGTPLDDSGFIWSYTNQRVISLESAGNIGVFNTIIPGESVITISHPKAQFSVDVLIYVTGNDEIPIYITTDNNVININTSDSNYQYAAELRGGDSGDFFNFSHEVLDGKDIIELRAQNNIGTINPKTKGIARIGISHPKSAYRLEIVVIVSEKTEYRYIDVDKNLIIMEAGNSELVRAEFMGEAPQDYIDRYSYELDNNGVISIQQSYNQFRINGLQKGSSILKIKNDYADFIREILIIVNDWGSVYDNEAYITTNQNVITTEAGGDDVLLKMTLVGGNEADRNNFIWTVDDSSIISAESAHGTVKYLNRSAASNAGESFEAQAVIKAKKVGTAKITLENPKAKNSFSVIVKVYKKGVFGIVPVVIDGPTVYKVRLGEKVPAYLNVVTGNERNLSNVTWSSENSHIVSVSGAGLTGVLEGISSGIATITVSGDNVKHNYTATVIVGNDEYVENIPFMYALYPFISVVKGESVTFRIMCENMSGEEIAGINVIYNDGGIIEVFAYKDCVTITGIELGESEIIIGSAGINTVKITVMVEDYEINPDIPYYLRSERPIYGLVKNHKIEISVNLVGGSAVNERGIIWKIENSNTAIISGNGRQCMITGMHTGQTVITVSHPKSHNELEIVIYVVENEADLTGKVIMHAKERNMLLNSGETRYISIITNASDVQKNGFQWNISNLNVIDVNVSAGRVQAYVTAKSTGNATITVRHDNQAIPVVIYVSVMNRVYGGSYINVPSIVEMIAGDTFSINAVTNNIHDKHNINWSINNNDIAVIYDNGDTCLVNALKGGNTIITAEHAREGFVKNIMLYVYNSMTEMANRYIIAGEQSRYIINRGDIININLVFGMMGYPEQELQNISWKTADNTVIEVSGNGKTAHVKGLNPGIGKITIASDIANTVDIEVEVREGGGRTGLYWFYIDTQDRIKGILSGSYADIEVKVYNGNNEVYNISGIEFIAGDNDIISVTANGSSIRVYAAAGREGQSYITVRHDLAEETRILVYTALSEYGLDSFYPILVEKSNYLINKGDSVTITVQTKDNDNSKIRNIGYSLERNNSTISIAERNKREIVVNALNAGSDVILVSYAATVQRIYVSVTEQSFELNAGYLITENIIGLVWGTEYETAVDTDMNDGIFWKKQNDHIISIVRSAGKSAVISGDLVGRTILTVCAGNIERNILVFVCKTEAELRQYQAINIEERYRRIRKHESVTINIHSYQGKVEGETRYGDYHNYDNPFGNVIEVNAVENNKLSVKGVNEGVAAIRVSNSFYNTEIIVYIEVANEDSGSVHAVGSRNYITALKTLYVINKNDQNVLISADAAGNNFAGYSQWVWSGYDDTIISVNYTGNSAIINPKKEGTTEISVSNRDCVNTLAITVIVGDRFVVDESALPYIYVEKNLYEVSKDVRYLTIPYSIVNADNAKMNNAGFTSFSDGIIGVSHDINNKTFIVEIYKTGIARFDIMYGDLRRDVYILVKEAFNSGNVYLTTSENFVIAAINELRTVNIQLMGYEEVNSGNFIWTVDKSGIIQLVGNGSTGQIYGLSEGEAVITVQHPKAQPYSLKINIKIVKDKVKENVIYLTTQRNVIETVVGTASGQIYVQKIGGDTAKNQCNWTVSDSSIISLTAQGYSAQYTAKKEGIARIQVTNMESNYKLEIVVIVKASLNNNIYIGSSSNLVLLKPGETQRRLSVELVNGEAKDNNKFVWGIDNQSPVDVNIAAAGGKVINIIGSNEECFINPVNEGTAQIRVRNEKAERDLIITVYVTYFEEIQFSVRNKEIVIGENEFVGINLPTYDYTGGKVRVWSEKPDGNSGSDICEVFYTNELVLLNGKKNGSVIVKAAIEGKQGTAQLYVNVAEKTDPNVNRIIVDKTLYVLNMKSEPVRINSLISGPYIIDYDNDNIVWQLNKPDIIDIAPSNMPVSNAKGRLVQITPKALGTVTILVKHDYIDESYWKQISIIVSDLNNNFRVSRTEIIVNNSMPETVRAEITGGTAKDYAEIKWTAKMQQKWDGTVLEVVRIMGSGREIILYPMNDGETDIIAVYGKEIAIIRVKVVSDYYFNFRNGNEYMYPGEIRNLPFDVRPAGSNISWVSGYSASEPIVTYGEVYGSSPTGESGNVVRNLRVEALHEGTTTITGMANGRISTVNIIVQYDYLFRLAKNVSGVPKYNGSGINSNGESIIEYTIYPPNTYIKAAEIPPGLEIEIMTPETVESNGKLFGVGKIKFTGHRELYTTVEFRHYKARKQGNDRETAIESATGIREIQVMYSFNENISPVPYFIRGDGTFSNVYSGKSSKKRYDGAYQGETLEPSNGRTTSDGIVYSLNNTYNLNMGDGEVHYILFDKKFNTAELDILGKENFQVANTLTDTDELEDGVGFDAQIVDITINGITQKAIRLSGGKDYIEYNRVLFNKELFLYVNSEYTNDSSNLSTKTIGLYDNDYIINYEIPVTVYEGLWYQTNHSSTVVGGGEATYKEYYLYRNENFDSLKENESTLFHSIFNPKYITSDPWLDQYHNNNTYTYYFTGDEYDTGNPFNPYSSVFRSILNKCDKVKVYRPAFYYTWEVYLEYRERLDSGGTNTSYLVYGTDEETGEKTKEIIGGYVLSYSMLDGHVVNKTRTQQMRVYEYDPEKIDSFNESDVNLPFGNIYDDNGNIYRWDKGRFTDNLISCLGSNYKNNYLYSSIAYEAEVLDVSKNGRVIESRFNVFGRHHVNSSGNATDPYGVYLRDFNFSAAYNQGSKAYSNWGYYDNTTRDWECFYYENILELPHYNGGGVLHSNDPSKMTTAIPINGIVKQGSYEKYIKSIVPETIYGHTVDRIIYGYSAIGPNKTGPNIFRNAGSNDNNLVYGQYGELYNCGLKIHTYTEYLNGNRTDRDYKILYSKSSAQQKLQWGNTAVKVIVPYYFFNRFPYRYEQSHPNINVANKNIVKISDEGGKPMPSINKNIKITKRGGITIKYKTFDYKNPGDDYSGNILINVTYQVRGCHNMYTGSRTDDSWINYADNSGINEYEGEQKSYFTGENSNTINSYFNNKLEIKKFLE